MGEVQEPEGSERFPSTSSEVKPKRGHVAPSSDRGWSGLKMAASIEHKGFFMRRLAIAHVENDVSQVVDIFSDGEMVATERYCHFRQSFVIELAQVNSGEIVIRFLNRKESREWDLIDYGRSSKEDHDRAEDVNKFAEELVNKTLSWTQVVVTLAQIVGALDGVIHAPLSWEHIQQVKESQYVPTPCGSFEVPILSTIYGVGSSIYHDGVNWVDKL